MNNFEAKNNDCHAALAMTKSVQSGRSMIEMLGVLAIIGVLSVGGIAGYSKAMTKYRINKTIEQITLIAGNIRAFWGPQKNYIGVGCYCNASGCVGVSGVDAHGNPTNANNGCPIVKKAKIFPDEMITVTDGKIMSITNPFGYEVSLGTTFKSKGGDNQAFYIIYDIGDNEEACIELLTKDWSNAGANVINFVSNMYMYFLNVPVSIDDAATLCDRGGDMINFHFDVDVNSSAWKNHIAECSVANGGC